MDRFVTLFLAKTFLIEIIPICEQYVKSAFQTEKMNGKEKQNIREYKADA